MTDESKPTIPDNAPWYAKTGMQVATNFGVPTLILLGIILFWMAREIGWAPNPVEERLTEIEKGQQAVLAGLQQNAGHDIRHDATMQEILKHLEESTKREQMNCVLKAKNDSEKKACFPYVSK